MFFPRAFRLTTLALLVFATSAFADPGHGQKIIDRGPHPWESQQVEEPCILVNPRDPSKLIMFYSGVRNNIAMIGKAWADVSDPEHWHEDEENPIFRPAANGWDSNSIRLDSVLYVPEEDSYYIYYSGTDQTVQDRIGLAIAPVGSDGYSEVVPNRIRRYGTRPILEPDASRPYFETASSQGAVYREWSASLGRWKWYMYYSYRGSDGILPGIRLAISSDGKNWSRVWNRGDSRGQIFRATPSAYYEWHQILKVENTYVLVIEVGVNRGERWRPVIAASLDPVRGWTELPVDTVLQTDWTSIYRDDAFFHVATPATYEVGGKWYLFVQACGRPASSNYIDGAWDMWVLPSERVIPTIPGGADIYMPDARLREDPASAPAAPARKKGRAPFGMFSQWPPSRANRRS